MRPASCGLATMESGNGILCRTGRIVEADIDLRSGSGGVGRARGRGQAPDAVRIGLRASTPRRRVPRISRVSPSTMLAWRVRSSVARAGAHTSIRAPANTQRPADSILCNPVDGVQEQRFVWPHHSGPQILVALLGLTPTGKRRLSTAHTHLRHWLQGFGATQHARRARKSED